MSKYAFSPTLKLYGSNPVVQPSRDTDKAESSAVRYEGNEAKDKSQSYPHTA